MIAVPKSYAKDVVSACWVWGKWIFAVDRHEKYPVAYELRYTQVALRRTP